MIRAQINFLFFKSLVAFAAMLESVTIKRFAYVAGPVVFAIGVWLLSSAIHASRVPSAIDLSISPRIFSNPSSINEQFLELQQYENKLKNYENELKVRSTLIENILNDIKQSDNEWPGAAEDNRQEYTKQVSKALGIGGGDERISPLFERHDGGKAHGDSLLRLARQDGKSSIISRMDFQIDRLQHEPIGLPVPGEVSSGFGFRHSPFSGRRHQHTGLDVAVEYRSPVRATANGTVVFAGYKGAYGRAIMIDHGNGMQTLYAHLSSISVTAGEKVCRGQGIGLVGMTGKTTGPHVHYEVRIKGEPVDPMPYAQLASLVGRLG